MPNAYHFTYTLILLYSGHALCDYPLQGDFLSQGKNRLLKGIPWYQCLWSHGLIHAGAVLLVTHSLALAVVELVVHMAIDYSKGRMRLTFNQDQFLHFACKILWAAVVVWGWPDGVDWVRFSYGIGIMFFIDLLGDFILTTIRSRRIVKPCGNRCCCHLYKGHEGLHRGYYPGIGLVTWTDRGALIDV